MLTRHVFLRGYLVVLMLVVEQLTAGELPTPPVISSLTFKNNQVHVQFTPFPAAAQFKLLQADALGWPMVEQTGAFTGYSWVGSAGGVFGFYRLEVVPLGEEAVFAATLLNRLAYGPTPDDLDRFRAAAGGFGPEAYIEEQLAPELIQEELAINRLPSGEGWQYVSVSGTASSSTLYVYLTAPGEMYLDDIKLGRGSEGGAGANLVVNGDFESALTGSWTVSTNHSGSAIVSDQAHGGNSSLHLVATSGGSTRGSAIWQTYVPSLASGQTYTLSYWYRPNASSGNLVIRLSGSGIESSPGSLLEKLTMGTARLDDLRAWHVLHAVQSRRQLFETMTQFFDNHFTTQYSKDRSFLDGRLTNNASLSQLATELEFRELRKWRAFLLDPNATFYDMLRVSAESPAMIIYLDTVTSSSGSPNENYSRELVELFTMGVDNGYDQKDIEEMSRAWTGWRVNKLPPGQETNPLATPVPNDDLDAGTWAFWFRSNRHDTKAKTIFAGKRVEARFGPGQAGRSYELVLPARTGNAGMQDGYDIIRHLADLPYTQEYICVKLCRLFVHENFAHGTYDYTDPGLGAEGRLVRDCMVAWETPAADGRKGNLRQVLRTIFESDLFRRQAASQQKVKTPLEFVVSSIRALRSGQPDGRFTAQSDGYDLLNTLSRLGMKLFDRDDPDGWSEFGRDWVNTSAFVERMRFIQNFLMTPSNPLKDADFGGSADDNICQPVELIKLKLASASWQDAGAVADYFSGLLFPAEGAANLDLDRVSAVAFLNSNASGAPNSSPFAMLDPSSAEYDNRVRGLVSLLMCLPRFQEQ